MAGEGSTLPAASLARTRNMLSPPGMLLYVFGEVQGAYAAWSSEHSKVTPASVAAKLKLAFVLVLSTGGAEVMNVSGGVPSPATMLQLYVAGSSSTLPAASVPRT